jgi:adenine-specific DNA methylase
LDVADFLANWAIRCPNDTVLDPSFGGGVFLESAWNRLLQLGGKPARQVFGIEIDPESHSKVESRLGRMLDSQQLKLGDFFRIETAQQSPVDAVIGNPPFIRYQRFSAKDRERALRCSANLGVELPKLCSSWAPFVVQATGLLREGGRLAMVLPMEIAHAKYAQPVLRFLRDSFDEVTFLTFRTKLFPNLSEDTLLVLANGKGGTGNQMLLVDLESADQLPSFSDTQRSFPNPQRIDAERIGIGKSRLTEYLIPEPARRLYAEASETQGIMRLGNLADVGIGYVTGANDFFHLSKDEVVRQKIPAACLKPIIRRGRALSGLRLSTKDWEQALSMDEAGYLLHVLPSKPIPRSVRSYLQHGEQLGVHTAYKCHVRNPWYCVQHVHKPDAFLTYMSGESPQLVANDARVYAPNTLHVLRMHPLFTLQADILALLWQTSLTRLSVELEGHALGGGMLKLEPTEAENVLIPYPSNTEEGYFRDLITEIDTLLRNGEHGYARKRADETILIGMLGFSKRDCKTLNVAADTLKRRRGYRKLVHGTT